MTGAAMAWLAVPCGIAFCVAFILSRTRFAKRLADVPNERSLHVSPRPRVGGLGIMAGALPFMLAFGSDAIAVCVVCAAFLSGISLIDDLRGLPIEVRLPAHALAALIVVLLARIDAPHAVLIAMVGVLAIAWSTNLFNFMDGADGLAGGMATIGFAAFAFASWGASAPLGASAAAIASASLGFLMLNFPPARVFMGDSGSIPLGFLAAALGWIGFTQGVWPAWFPVLVFSPFIADATVTLARRALRREAVWRAHRSHYYQRLVLHGWSKTRLAVSAYALMIASSSSALVAMRMDARGACAIIAVWTAIWVALFIAIDRRAPSNRAR
jgi:UDP-GlcNAc:undecaprenyl-phosphate GlcNAc-1-phosphate transferase